MGKGVSPESSERYSFNNGEYERLTMEERRDLFQEAFGGSNYNALKYVSDFDDDYGFKRKSKNDL